MEVVCLSLFIIVKLSVKCYLNDLKSTFDNDLKSTFDRVHQI